MRDLNYVSVSQIIFPKIIYQIETTFTLTITNGATNYVVTFYPGNITFQNILNKIATVLGPTYTVREYLSDQS